MYKDVLKRMTAIFLCACMVGTSIDVGGLTVRAAEEEQTVETGNSSEEKDVQGTEAENPSAEEDVPEEVGNPSVEEEVQMPKQQNSKAAGERSIETTEENVPAARAGQVDLSSLTSDQIKITYDQNNVYDGTQKEPIVSAVQYKEGADWITLGKEEYYLGYGTNVNAGEGTLTINATGINYINSYTMKFTISPVSLDDVYIDRSAVTDQTYTGKPVKPNVTISMRNGQTLSADDYEVEYKDAGGASIGKDVGSKTLTITGKRNCTGTKTYTYEVTAKSLNEEGLDFTPIPEMAYANGSAVSPSEVTIMYGDEMLIKGRDYELTCTNNTGITDQAQARITGKGNYTGTKILYYTIGGKDIANCTVTLSQAEYTYNGKNQEPTVTVQDPTMTNQTVNVNNYDVSFSDSKNAGTCRVTVTGKGTYKGTNTSATYTIKQYDLSDATNQGNITIDNVSSAVYNGGDEVRPTPRVFVNGIGYLTENEDFVYAYDKNRNASSDAEVIIRGDIQGSAGNFTGSISKKFTIRPRDLSKAEITVEDWKRPNNKPNPNVVVTYKNEDGSVVELQRDTDYKVKFVDATDTTKELDSTAEEQEGIALIEPLPMDGNYEKSGQKRFTIYGNLANATVSCDNTFTYDGTVRYPSGNDLSVTSNIQKNSLTEGTDYTVKQHPNSVEVGTYEATLEGMGTYANNKKVSYEIVQKSLNDSDITWIISNPKYEGSKVYPTVIAELPSGVTLEQGKDFWLSEIPGQDYVRVGENIQIEVVSSSGGETSKNFKDKKTIKFNIEKRPIGDGKTKADDIIVEGVEEDYAYTGNAIDPTKDSSFAIKRRIYGADTTLQKDVDYRITSVTNNKLAGIATITVTGEGNYNGTFQINFHIKYPIDSVYTTWKMGKMVGSQFQETNEFEYDLGKAVIPELRGSFSHMAIRDDLVEGEDYYIECNNNYNVSTSTSKASVTITGMNDYTGTTTLEFEIIPKSIEENTENILENPVAFNMIYDGMEHKRVDYILVHTSGSSSYDLQPNIDYDIISYVDTGDEDPTITNSPCINAGDVKVTLKGKGNYQGERTVTYKIEPMNFEDTQKIQMTQPADIPYDGNSHKLTAAEISGTYTPGVSGSRPIAITEKDYDVVSWVDTGDKDPSNTNSDCIKAGKVTITLVAKDKNYTGTRTIEYNIIAKPLEDSDISMSLDKSSTVYDRTAQNPGVEVKSTNTAIGTLTEGEDYEVSYKKQVKDAWGVTVFESVAECKDAGSYRIYVDGINNFSGTLYKDFVINKRNLNENSADYRFAIAKIENQTYTGEEIIPEELEVFEYVYDATDPTGENAEDRKKKGDGEGEVDMTPQRDIDYTVSGVDNTNATQNQGGTKASLTIEGQGNYEGVLQTTFTIDPKNVNDKTGDAWDVHLTEILHKEYIAAPIDPALPLEYNGHALERGEDKDFTVSYEVDKLNEEGTTEKVATNIDMGPVYGTITGHGNYTGTRTFTENDPIFIITPRSIANNYKEDNTGDIKVTVEEENHGLVIYDGLEHTPEVTLRDTLMGETPLTEGVDYDVTYSNAVDAGVHTITIEGKNNYTDKIEINYVIHPKRLLTGPKGEFIEGSGIDPDSVVDRTYTGAELTQEPVIRDKIKVSDEEGNVSEQEVILTEGKDYTLSYDNNINASTEENKAVMTVTFSGNYTGYYENVSQNLNEDYTYNTYDAKFNVLQREITDEGINVEKIPAQSYNKNPQEPDPVITYGKTEESEGYRLIKDTDYTLTYNEDENQENGEHTNQGTVNVTIRGMGNFKGSTSTSFEIIPKSLDKDKSPDITVAPIENQIYTGGNIVPKVTVTYGDVTLTPGVDYETAPGTNTVTPGMATVVIKGMGNYSEQRIVEFKIVGDLGKDADVESIPIQAYTGTEVKPAEDPRVTFKGKLLIKGVDYDVVLSKNTEVGTAEYTIVGKDGYYTGSKTVGFRIAYDLSKTTTQVQTVIDNVANSYTYTADVIKPVPKITYAGKELKQGTDYTVTYKNNINTGTAEMTVTGQNDYMGSVTNKFKIVTKNLANCTIAQVGDLIYDGKAKTPDVVIKNGSVTLVKGKDYTVKYQENKDPGVGQVSITGINNYSGTVIRYFNIKVAAPNSLKVASFSSTSIKLSWKSGGKVTGYQIYRLESNGKYKRIATTKSLTYTNTKLSNSKVYKYKVRAYFQNSKGNVYSSFTNVLTANTRPETTKISVSAVKSKQLKIKWAKLNSATGYEIYQSTSKNGKYTKIKAVSKNTTTSYTKTKLTSQKTYYYKVRAYKNLNGKKVYSNYSSVKGKKVK